jgi:peptidoglycan/LPS O-acetylase OafA/YrhL
VDIFFFISGYIVTRMLEEKYFPSTFNYKEFYLSRFWRLYPTLVTSLLITMMISFLFFSIDETKATANHALFSFLGLSNFVYFRESGIYGMASTENDPLLHLWSLSVEFQFYLLFPLIHYTLVRLQRRIDFRHFLLLVYGALIVVSLVANIVLRESSLIDSMVTNRDMLFFYMLPFRSTIFLIGVFAYLIQKSKLFLTLDNQIFKNSLNLSLIIVGLFIVLTTKLSSESLFYRTLILILSTGIIVLMNEQRTKESKIDVMSAKAGGYAYSLYLLHLPLVVFIHLYFPSNPFVPIGATFLAILLAVFIAKKVEFASSTSRPRARMIFLTTTLMISCIFTQTLGKTSSINKQFFRSNGAQEQIVFGGDNCNDQSQQGTDGCSWNLNEKRTIYVVGDSQAAAILPAVISLAQDLKYRVVMGGRSGCPFFEYSANESVSDSCDKVNQDVWRFIKSEKPEIVVVANLSTGYLKSKRKTLALGKSKCMDSVGNGCLEYKKGLESLAEEIRLNRGIVILLSTIPDFSTALVRKPLNFNPEFDVTRSNLELIRSPSRALEIEVDIKFENLYSLDPYDYLCNEESCDLVQKGSALYVDPIHLSPMGADKLKDPLRKLLLRANP